MLGRNCKPKNVEKDTETIQALWRRAANIRCAVDSTLRPGERRIDVMRITYPEQSQVLHLTDALSTLVIHKRGGSHEGQRGAFNYVPKNG